MILQKPLWESPISSKNCFKIKFRLLHLCFGIAPMNWASGRSCPAHLHIYYAQSESSRPQSLSEPRSLTSKWQLSSFIHKLRVQTASPPPPSQVHPAFLNGALCWLHWPHNRRPVPTLGAKHSLSTHLAEPPLGPQNKQVEDRKLHPRRAPSTLTQESLPTQNTGELQEDTVQHVTCLTVLAFR